MASRIESLREKRDQLNARINREAAKERQNQRRERDGRLMRWGVVVEQMIEQGRMEPNKWAEECRRYLSRDKDLERALSGPLEQSDRSAGAQGDEADSDHGRETL